MEKRTEVRTREHRTPAENRRPGQRTGREPTAGAESTAREPTRGAEDRTAALRTAQLRPTTRYCGMSGKAALPEHGKATLVALYISILCKVGLRCRVRYLSRNGVRAAWFLPCWPTGRLAVRRLFARLTDCASSDAQPSGRRGRQANAWLPLHAASDPPATAGLRPDRTRVAL